MTIKIHVCASRCLQRHPLELHIDYLEHKAYIQTTLMPTTCMLLEKGKKIKVQVFDYIAQMLIHKSWFEDI